MAGLREVVQGFADREGVEAVVVVSGDGLPIDQVIREGLDAEAVAALTATVAQGARRLGQTFESARFTTGVLEFESQLVVFSEVGADNLLMLLIAADTNIGPLLYDLRRHGPAIAALL
ncbi:MAG TPA: roadblock/LC7 domain-containing protein [Gemmatimonadales bacterium]|jgi:predicted regulator of Ras-like GTPase activity (Roadblock/LC7/MglB family)|nr:roadblock/LC7 domain-containing protein [Gemmatimonadales bacterium]